MVVVVVVVMVVVVEVVVVVTRAWPRYSLVVRSQSGNEEACFQAVARHV